MIRKLHGKIIQERQREVLSDRLKEAVLAGLGGERVSSILDVGCGDGVVAHKLATKLGAEVVAKGLEVFPREKAVISVEGFDGESLPFAEDSFDVVILSDVLHHVPTRRGQRRLFVECARVAKKGVVLKDHVEKWLPDRLILGMMDWFGNSFHGVACPGNYLSPQDWESLYSSSGVISVFRRGAPLGIHPPLFSWLTEKTFWGGDLQFVEFLKKR